MNDRPINCNIKNPVCLTIPEDKHFNQTFHSGCKIIDISFPSVINPEIGEIQFQNYYVAFLTLKVKIKMTEETPKQGVNDQGWRIALKRYKLMPDAHAETGSQDIFSLTKKHFLVELSNVVTLRLILQQPSPVWKDFSLTNIKLFRPLLGSRATPIPSWVLEETKKTTGKKEIEPGSLDLMSTPNTQLTPLGVPDLDILSSNLQQLWALAEEVSTAQTDSSIGRYEVDGCYDINLLSYT
ncbi:nicolin-1-like isoform X2 [Physella acuta]|uniref:nicolin-1-like isoform X2 n=1 Tax=Physella acuta TaxID=109671 RepID=UPI0027DCE570|nr:nicolin-1-like isoform X2 [Physella acuta]